MENNKLPRGFFKHVLAMDCETTGFNGKGDDVSSGHQAVAWGLIVADTVTLKPVEELYLEIKWNDFSKEAKLVNPKFGVEAEGIHGLTYEYLEKHGIEESVAVEKIGNMILKYWSPENHIRTLGHNVHIFDMPFLRSMFRRHGINLQFGSRHYCSSSLGFGIMGTYNSDDLFELFGFEKRDDHKHNALDDAHMSLETFRLARKLWGAKVGITYEIKGV